MRLDAWDSVFVRVSRRDIHPVLVDIAGWGRWWPGMVTEQRRGHVAVTLRPPRLLGGAQRLRVALRRQRPDLGLDLDYGGDLVGDAEFFYLDEPAGTVVHYLLRADAPDRGWRRTLADHRAGARAGLHELKRRFEAGRRPGDEPDPRLLAHQRAAMHRRAEPT